MAEITICSDFGVELFKKSEPQATWLDFVLIKTNKDVLVVTSARSRNPFEIWSLTNFYRALKIRDIADKSSYSQSFGVSSSRVWMWELGHKEGWELKNWGFRTVVSKKTLEGLLDCKEIKAVNTKEISPEYVLEGLMLKLKLQ